MPFIVLKFGGSSQCEEGLNVILKKTNEYLKKEYSIIFVISAVGKTTNNLYSIINGNYDVFNTVYMDHFSLSEKMKIDFSSVESKLSELKQEINKLKVINETLMDSVDNIEDVSYNLKVKIISFGEILSSMIVYQYLKKFVDVEYYDVTKLIKNKNSSNTIDKKTLNIKGEFYCDANSILDIKDKFKSKSVIVTQGFIAATTDNKICILTRSGSNTSASLITSAIDAERLEIWTDVSGLYTGDPRKISNTKVIKYVNYSVCQEAAAMGSQIIHPFSIKPCQEKSIPIHIKNTFKPDDIGTIITKLDDTKDEVHLVSCQSDVTLFEITSMDMWEGYGFVYDIFKVFNEEKIDVNIITTSQFTISTTTNEKNNFKINNLVNKLREKYSVNIMYDCMIVSVIANNVKHNEQIQKVHNLISLKESIHMIHYGANNLSVSYVVNKNYGLELMETLHYNLICNYTK
jgi:aspartate kinase